MEFAWLGPSIISICTGVIGYFIHSLNKKIDELQEEKLSKKEHEVQVEGLKDDIGEIKANVEYIRRKLER